MLQLTVTAYIQNKRQAVSYEICFSLEVVRFETSSASSLGNRIYRRSAEVECHYFPTQRTGGI